MKSQRYKQVVDQHVEDCRALNLPLSELASSILHSADAFQDEEVRNVFISLPEDLMKEINSVFSDYRETGEYYVVSSTGATKDLSKLMERLSQLV